MEDKKNTALETQTQEQSKEKTIYSDEDLENIATQIVFKFYDKHISPVAAKQILKYCEKSIDLNSEIVLYNGSKLKALF